MNKTIVIYKYHVTTANGFQIEELEKNISFAAFTNSIENEMLGVEYICPIGNSEEIMISDIRYIEFIGKEEIVLDTEMNRYLEV